MARTARDLMNPVVYSVPETSRAGAVFDRLQATELSFAAVHDGAGKHIGLVSLGQLARADRRASVAAMSACCVEVSADASFAEMAAAMSERDVDRLVVVDDGRAEGFVAALDLVREAAGLPPARSRWFPSEQLGVRWSEEAPLELGWIGAAPMGSGVVALSCAGDRHEHPVWAEYTDDLRGRLIDMLAEPTAEDAALCALLESRKLLFRVAVVADQNQARRIVDVLQRQAGHALGC